MATKILDYISITEAAKYLGKSRQTLHTWCKNGKLKSIKAGSARLIKFSDLVKIK